MYTDLDALILSGQLFGNDSPPRARSPSPRQSRDANDSAHASTSRFSFATRTFDDDGDDGDEFNDNNDNDDADFLNDRNHASLSYAPPSDAGSTSIGLGPGRTGVKGVLRDRAEANALARAEGARVVRDRNADLERRGRGAMTFDEEERVRALEWAANEGVDLGELDNDAHEEEVRGEEKEVQRLREAMAGMGLGGFSLAGMGISHKSHGGGVGESGKFGHLREVNSRNFVSAVEKEGRGVWVVVHIYDPSLDRCHDLDSTLVQLARLHPYIKFLRARASTLGFASSSSSSSLSRRSRSSRLRPPARTSRIDEDEEDPYAYDDLDKEHDSEEAGTEYQDEDREYDDEDVDVDVLPTLLVYRDGELTHTWVRVDWEAGHDGIADLLSKHQILPSIGLGSLGLPLDDDDDDRLGL